MDRPKKPPGLDLEGLETDEQRAEVLQKHRVAYFKYKHRNIRKSWGISVNFPEQAVITAYVKPRADRSTEPFSWAKPDVEGLRAWCMEKLGWSFSKTEQQLKPVLAKLASGDTPQSQLDLYFGPDSRVNNIKSTRLATAVRGLTRKLDVDEKDVTPKPKPKLRRAPKKKEAGQHEHGIMGETDTKAPKPKAKSKRKPKSTRRVKRKTGADQEEEKEQEEVLE